MLPISPRPALIALLVLLCAACGGSDEADLMVSTLRADSAFSTPITIRIPRQIRVTARVANSGRNGLSGIERFGPEQFRQLDPPMNVLRAAGVLRVTDRSQRMLVHSSRIGFSPCVPYHYSAPAGSPGHPSCNRVTENRTSDYSHTVQVTPAAALGTEWRDDVEPWEPVFSLAGVEFTPGWVVELGRRQIVEVGEVRNPELGIREVDYTWRWAVTPAGSHFDPNGATLRAFSSSLRTFPIAGIEDGLHPDSVYTGTATLTRTGSAWQVIEIRWRK